MQRKYTTEKVVPIFKQYGYQYLFGESKSQYSKVTISDEYGYLYYVCVEPLVNKENKKYCTFGNGNPYTIENIHRFLYLNNANSKLLTTKYVNAMNKMEWKCLLCGNTYNKSWNKFQFSNMVCNCCSFKLAREKTKLSIYEVESRLKSKGWKLQDGETYVGNNQPINVINDDGYMAKTTISNIEQAESNVDLFNLRNPYTIENLKIYLKLNKIPLTLLSTKYNGYTEDLTFKCACGERFNRSLATLMSKDGLYLCKKCLLNYKSLLYRKNISDIYEDCKSRGYNLLTSKYENQKTKLKVEDKDGYLYNITIDAILNSEQPQRFSKLNSYRMHNVLNYIKINDLKIKPLFKNYYEQKTDKLEFTCECGNVFTTTIDALIYSGKSRCNKCSMALSNLELKVKTYLDECGIEYSPQQTFYDLIGVGGNNLRYDFYIPNKNLLIEVQGEQHYKLFDYFGGEEGFKIRLEHDNRKREYTKNNKIKLLEIPYWEFKDNTYVQKLEEVINL